MSAIWGMVLFDSVMEEQTGSIMREKYEKHCRLDKLQDVCEPDVYMGAGIQYITAQSRKEALPILDRENHICLTADCILDNRKELIEQLHMEEPVPDGTLMYMAYLKWGMDFLSHCRGIFSAAVYDRKDKAVYLGTDQTASRCLYYYRHRNGITFSSLIEPILKLHPDIGSNTFYIRDFLSAPGLMPNISSVETPYEGVYKLNPGTVLKFTPSGQEEHIYWQPSFPFYAPELQMDGKKAEKGAKEYGDCFCRLYKEAVDDTLCTDANVGIALSSGLDSASAGALAAMALEKMQKKLYAYTYITSEMPVQSRIRGHVLDEREDVKKLTEMYPNMESVFLNNEGKNCCENLSGFLRILEIPYKAFINMPNLGEIYEQAHQAGCRVILCGQMGNSTVSNGYIDDVLYDLYCEKHYITFLKYLNRYCIGAKESRKQALRGIRRYYAHADKAYKKREFKYKPDNLFLREEILQGYPLRERLENEGFISEERLPSPAYIYRENLCKKSMYTYLGELETKMGLHYGVVIRDPTRDMRLISFCYHMPYRYFAYMGTPRWLLRGNMRDMLPSELVDNWLRYGVQNSDWLLRLSRDWENIRPAIEKALDRKELASLTKKEEMLRFLQDWDKSQGAGTEIQMMYLMFIYVLALFYDRE